MKSQLSFFQKVGFALNVFFAICLLLAYVLPFVPPTFSAFLSILNLGLPVFILINIGFAFYWLLKLKRHFFVSALLVLGGYSYFSKIIVFNENPSVEIKNSLKVMSYNVRLFNYYKWIEKAEVGKKISDFIKAETPDIVAFQDYYKANDLEMSSYPYVFEKYKSKSSNVGIAIFSKYKIIHRGSVDFPNTHNNAIYADIVVKKDTLRVYAVHLESLKIIPDVQELRKEDRQQLFNRVGKSFVKQQEQASLLSRSFSSTSLPKIVCMDMNNTAFSYVASQLLKHNLKDAFVESGYGLGKTFDFDFLPLRIDVIFNEKSLHNANFKNYSLKLSDHYPIMASFKLSE
jgi:endonuclease/exonuclease/phosphatase family metal-dependent hydrolase